MTLAFPPAFPAAFPLAPALHPSERFRRVTALLGPTNTGKTYLTIERMLSYDTGIIGLPLRLLAREVYNRVVERVGAEHVALVTGEEKIKPQRPRYWISTVEAMPRDLDVDFVAVDEVQLATDMDRGHTFTDRLLHRRGKQETWLVGASTMQPAIERLLPGAPVVTRPRLSQLSFAGARKLSRLPPRSAIVAFSAEEVYAIAELIRRQHGGAAVVLGALSPRTRNAQVALYQNGEVDYIVATDAIGMGLNLDVDHVAFAADTKYDGWHNRRLHPAEFAQIAGRAGRHVRDGTFGTTGRCPPFDEELVEALEQHRFDPVETLQWRNSGLDFGTIASLQASLDKHPTEFGLTRAPLGVDVLVLDILAHDADVQKQVKTRADVQRLWDACQVPDYRKLSPAAHADLVLTLFRFIVRARRVPDDWFAQQIATFDRTDGDIDALSARTAQMRTFNYIANRPDWLDDPEHWQGVTRQVEDSLSDALHARLTHRFVDRRTSLLMRRLRENAMLEAEINSGGDVLVEGENVGRLNGFCFTADPHAAGEAAKALNTAAQKALASEIEARATRVNDAVDAAFLLSNDGFLRWLGEPIGRLTAGDHILAPKVRVVADGQLVGASLELVQTRLDRWMTQHIMKLLGGLSQLEAAEGVEGIARGIAFQVAEGLGVLERARVGGELKSLDQNGRAALRKLGVRFGAYHLFMPQLLKPGPRSLAALLWTLKHGGLESVQGLGAVAHLASSGRTSFAADKDTPRGLYQAAGFRLCGERAVRVDIIERLADIIRPAMHYRPGISIGEPPPGTADGDEFVVSSGMTSLAGCSGEAFASILKSLGYTVHSRNGPAITAPLLSAPVVVAPAADAPVDAAPGEAASEAAGEASSEAASEAASEAPVEASSNAAEPSSGDGANVAEAPPDETLNPEPEPELKPEPEQKHSESGELTSAIGANVPPVAVDEGDAEAIEIVGAQEPAAPAIEAVTADAAAALDAMGGEPVTEPDVTPAMIEVWRQGRRPHHSAERPERQRPRGPRRDGGRRTSAPGAPVDAQIAPAVASGETATPSTGPSDAPAGERPPRRDRARKFEGFRAHGERRPHANKSDFKPDPNAEPKPAPEPDHKPDQMRSSGPPHREGGRNKAGRPERGDRPFATTQRPAARERQPDPNSPFAALLALKAQLENKGRKE